jgi:hypothetical protein
MAFEDICLHFIDSYPTQVTTMSSPCPAPAHRTPLVLSLLAAATALSLAGCGGGGGGQSFALVPAPAAAPVAEAPAPVAQAPAAEQNAPEAAAPAPAPAPADGPAVAPSPAPAPGPAPAPKTWKDADCSHAGSNLPACSSDFSDNSASVTVVPQTGGNVIQVQTVAHALATTKSTHSGVMGNKGIYALGFLHQVKLSDFPGISFDMKLDSTTTNIDQAYVTYTVSLDCSGSASSWLNLLTYPSEMEVSPAGTDGYATYSATPADAKWRRSGSSAFAADGNTLLNAAINTNAGPLSLTALIAKFPKACIYNFPNPDASPALSSVTPAVQFNLSDKNNILDKMYWLKDIKIGDVTVF